MFGSTGAQVSAIGQGTWNIETGDRKAAVEALRVGIELGMTHIDTAEMYGSGVSEQVVGEAISGRRDGLFVISKVLPGNATREGTMGACEKSLSRLGIDRLDCYLLHWRGRHPLDGTVEAFERLKEQGKIASWGVSNFDVDDLDEVWRLAPAGSMVCNQVLYHLDERAIEHAVIPWCEAHGVAVVAYSPFGSGSFPKAKALAQMAEARGVTARQIALAFLTRRNSVFAIPKSSSPAHVEENAGAGDLTLSEKEIAGIEAAFPRKPRPRSLPMI